MQRWPDFHSADGHLLYAIALEEDGRDDEALANYANVGEYFPGVEPRVRQAQLLQKLGREAEAKAVAQDVVRGLRRAPAHVRRNQRPWLVSAQTVGAELNIAGKSRSAPGIRFPSSPHAKRWPPVARCSFEVAPSMPPSPSLSQSSGVLTIDLAALADNWRALAAPRRARPMRRGRQGRRLWDRHRGGRAGASCRGLPRFFRRAIERGRARQGGAGAGRAGADLCAQRPAGGRRSAGRLCRAWSRRRLSAARRSWRAGPILRRAAPTPPPCAIHLDTGMNRLGFRLAGTR